MLTIRGDQTSRFCDGISRRDFLRVGGLGMGGLSLPHLLAAEQANGIRQSHKAVIMIYMAGAPPHQDLFEIKTDAPSDYRGEFSPIKTNVPGIEICELLPGLAKVMDKCVPIRSMVGSPNGSHDSFICYTGRPGSSLDPKGQPPGGWPSMGSVLSRLQGSADSQVPAFVGLAPKAGHPPYGSPGDPGFLGTAHSAFRPTGPGMEDMTLNGMNLDRLGRPRRAPRRFRSVPARDR